MALQKLLYFAHGTYLLRTKAPLVTGYFEAWVHGPVHPGAYQAFRVAGDKPISFRAARENILTGEKIPLPRPDDVTVIALVRNLIHTYGDLSAARLRQLSHAPGGPWDIVVKQGRASASFGLRISDEVILRAFQKHKIAVEALTFIEDDPGDDAPFT